MSRRVDSRDTERAEYGRMEQDSEGVIIALHEHDMRSRE